MQQLTDNALMLKVKSGDLDKLGLLYERHKKRLFGFFYNLDHNSGLSEDLVQNVFVRMLKYRHTYSGDGSFLSWMFSMARNVRYDHYKKNGQKYTDLSQVEYRMGDDETAEVKMERKDNVFIIQRAMMQLDSDKREVLVLSKFKEMKFSNINGHITLESVSDSVLANTTNGELKVTFNSISSGKNMAFSSFNGDVEVLFPKSLKANVKAKSDMGDVYTDFDMTVSKNEPQVDKSNSSGKYRVKLEQWVKGTINGGGPEMLFKTFNGDIMIKSR